MRRLRNCAQLSYCSAPDTTEDAVVYSTATYDRFAHSMMVLGWLETWKYYTRYAPWRAPLPDEETVKHLRAAALLHDTGHTAYSHALELETPYRHEERTKRLVTSGKVAGILEKHKLNPKRVADLIEGKDTYGPLISGELDVDKVAYVFWDSHISGINVPFRRPQPDEVDGAIRMLRFMQVYDGKFSLRLFPDDHVNGDEAVLAAINLLESRTLLTMSLYGCAANSKTITLMRNAVQSAIEARELDPLELFRLTDRQLEQHLAGSRRARQYVSRISGFKLPKTAVALSLPKEKADDLRKLAADRTKRLEFEERTGAILDINPLPKAPKGEFPVYDGENFVPLAQAPFWASRFPLQVTRENHERFVTNRLVAYAYKEPERVGRKVCRELGIETPKELVALSGFIIQYHDIDTSYHEPSECPPAGR